ncbi:MAG: hypothetical protein P8011_01000 [Acidihalobacter sp.]|uniref:hypothetical protein n=1 Tax=Acidihalobacter sp. TaxID=1872108 RepID=UPI00307DBF1A
MTDENTLQTALDHHLEQGERALDAALLALLETHGEAPLAHLAHTLGVEHAQVLRSVHGLAERGRIYVLGRVGPGQRAALASEDETFRPVPVPG